MIEIILSIILISFLCELIDSSLGMGYGTILTPVLLLFGFEPIVIIPGILISEAITGILAAYSHYRVGNIDFNKQELKVSGVLALCSIMGVIIAGFIILNLDMYYIKLYIGLTVLLMGIIILLFKGNNYKFSFKKIVFLGTIASFNKSISGGGYGPLVTSGQILSGIRSKSAIAITSLAEGLTCVVGIIMYIICTTPNLGITIPLLIGSLLSIPVTTYVIKRINTDNLTLLIGITTTVLGLLTIIKLVI